jgi:hypothetical protein
VRESEMSLNPAWITGSKRSGTLAEQVLLCVFIALFVQLLFILVFSSISGLTPIFVERLGFQIDFNDFIIATSDWRHGIDPYLRIRFNKSPLTLLAALPFQLLGSNIGRIAFLFIDIAIVAASLAGLCHWFKMTRRECILLYGIASIYFPVIFLLQRGNLDGIMLGLILVSIFTKNPFIKILALSLSIGFKVYSILLLIPLMMARQWRRVAAVLLVLALLMLPFYSLLWSFIVGQTGRSAELLGAENICPIGLLSPIDVTDAHHHYALNHAVIFAYLALWIASYAWMLFKNRGSDLKVKSVYSFAWMIAMPLQVFPYSGVLLLPLLVLKSREMSAKGFIAVLDYLFLIGFCLVGFQQTAFSSYFHYQPAATLFPHAVRLLNLCNPLGTALVLCSITLQAADRNKQIDATRVVPGF